MSKDDIEKSIGQIIDELIDAGKALGNACKQAWPKVKKAAGAAKRLIPKKKGDDLYEE